MKYIILFGWKNGAIEELHVDNKQSKDSRYTMNGKLSLKYIFVLTL